MGRVHKGLCNSMLVYGVRQQKIVEWIREREGCKSDCVLVGYNGNATTDSRRRKMRRDSNATSRSQGGFSDVYVPIVGDEQLNVSPTATAHDNSTATSQHRMREASWAGPSSSKIGILLTKEDCDAMRSFARFDGSSVGSL